MSKHDTLSAKIKDKEGIEQDQERFVIQGSVWSCLCSTR